MKKIKMQTQLQVTVNFIAHWWNINLEFAENLLQMAACFDNYLISNYLCLVLRNNSIPHHQNHHLLHHYHQLYRFLSLLYLKKNNLLEIIVNNNANTVDKISVKLQCIYRFTVSQITSKPHKHYNIKHSSNADVEKI